MSLSKKMVYCGIPYNEILYKIKWTLPAHINMNEFHKMQKESLSMKLLTWISKTDQNYTHLGDTLSVNVLPEKQSQYI